MKKIPAKMLIELLLFQKSQRITLKESLFLG